MALVPTLLLLTLLAGFTQGATGFGFGMVVMAVLPQLMDVREAVPMVAVLSLGVNSMVLWRWWGSVEGRKVLPLIAGGVVGTPLGVMFLVEADPRVAKAILGGVVLLYAVGSLLHEWRGSGELHPPRPDGARSRAQGVVAGVLGGVTGGAFNMGGPPAILHAAWQRWDPAAFKGNLQGFFVVVTIFQVVLFATGGHITPRLLELDLIALPALVVGVLAGIRAARGLDPVRFRRVVLVMLVVLGASLLARSVWA